MLPLSHLKHIVNMDAVISPFINMGAGLSKSPLIRLLSQITYVRGQAVHYVYKEFHLSNSCINSLDGPIIFYISEGLH